MPVALRRKGWTVVFIFRDNEILLNGSVTAFPDRDVCTLMGLNPDELHALSPAGNGEPRACHVSPDVCAPAGYEFHKLRAVLPQLDELAPLVSRAFQVSEWARTHRYCGVCAATMHRSKTELCFHCPDCGFAAYPRVSPAMMVLIRRGDHILLARHNNYATTRYTALAGFVEAGESIEDAIHREVHEEVGLSVSDIRYFGSQSWPFPHSLMIAFTAEYAGGELRLQENEIEDAQWFGPGDTLPEIPMNESIAGRLIRANLPKR